MTRLERIRFHGNIAAVHRNGREFYCERIVSARIVARGGDSAEYFASGFQYRPSMDGNILGEFRFESSAYGSLRAEGTNRAYAERCPSGNRRRIQR